MCRGKAGGGALAKSQYGAAGKVPEYALREGEYRSGRELPPRQWCHENNHQQTCERTWARREVRAQPVLNPSGGQCMVLKSVLQAKCYLRGIFRRLPGAKKHESSSR